MIRLPFFILTWLGFFLIRSIFILLGLVLVPVATAFRLYHTIKIFTPFGPRDILAWRYKILWPWGNEEDGLAAGEEFPTMPLWFRIIYWSAIRNPANNLRYVKYLSVQIKPEKVNYIGTQPRMLNGYVTADEHLLRYDMDSYRFATLTWCGNYSNLRIQFKMFNKIWRFWIGWKIYPHDMLGIDPTDYRFQGAGFATQFKRIYPRN